MEKVSLLMPPPWITIGTYNTFFETTKTQRNNTVRRGELLECPRTTATGATAIALFKTTIR